MKKTFLTGFAVVVPFALTFWVLFGVFGSIDSWVNGYLQQWLGFNFTGVGIILLVLVTFATGVIARTSVGKFFYELVNKIIFRVPLINKVYKLAKETVDVITTKQAFKTVVKVEFPTKGVYSMGFLTNKDTIFVPTTPNPTNGFLFQTDKYQVLDISVEEALRHIISMGTIGSELSE